MPRKRGLISGASLGARLSGLINHDDTIDFLRSFGNGLRNYTISEQVYNHGTDMVALRFGQSGTKAYIVQSNGDLKQYTLSTAYDFSTKTLDGTLAIDELSERYVKGFTLSADGRYMYIAGGDRDGVAMFTLSTPFDVTGSTILRGVNTTIHNDIAAPSQANESAVRGFAMKSDGTRIYSCGYGNDRLYQWSLSTAFDLSTCSYDGHYELTYQNDSYQKIPRALDFKSDGTKVYVLDDYWDNVYEISLSVAWDLTSGTLTNSSTLSISGSATGGWGLRFRPDGRSFYLLDSSSNDLHEFRMTTSWDISTATVGPTTLSLSSINDHLGFSWNTDGTQLVVCNGENADLAIMNCPAASAGTYSFNVTASGSTDYTVSGTDREGSVSGGDPNVYVHVGDTIEFAVNASGHPFYIRESAGGSNVSGPTNQGTTNATVSWTPSTAGAYVYQCGNHSGMVGNIFVEPKGYDLSQMTTTGRTTISMDENVLNNSAAASGQNYDFYHVAIADCLIVDSGTKILMLDPWNTSYDKFTLFPLRVTDDVTTLIDGCRGFSTDNAQATNPWDLVWSPNGDKFFALDMNADKILQYSVTTPFIIDRFNTTYDGSSQNVDAADSAPIGMCFSPDGTLLFVVGSSEDILICFQLANPYDVITPFTELGGTGNNRDNLNEFDTYVRDVLMEETDVGVSIFWIGDENDSVYRKNLLGF